MDGFAVMPSVEAARTGEVFITVTGGLKSIGQEHLKVMADGAVLANSGHFNVEIDIPTLEAMSTQKQEIRPFVEEYLLKDGRRIYLLAEGRLINLSAAEGHPSSVMDMSFANQALSVEYLADRKSDLTLGVHPVPKEMDMEVGRLKLRSMGVEIDTLSSEQQSYLESWEEGT
jgi:adenosylhomocysteinase